MSETNIDALLAALHAPFDPREIKFRAGATNGARALALAYIDARLVQDRLDAVMGVVGWQDEYECLPDGSVVCRLKLRINGEWITKVDVGGESEQKDGGDRRKAAFSDALKRAAVKFGIGRYLYSLPAVWVDYDPQRKQLKAAPTLPPWALPGKTAASPAPTKTPPASNGKKAPPEDGVELEAVCKRAEMLWVRDGLCTPERVMQAMHAWAREEMGCDLPMAHWPADVVAAGCQQLKEIKARLQANRGPIGADEQKQLVEMLARKGLKWSNVIRAHNLPNNAASKDLMRGQWQEIMAGLEDEADAEPARS